MFAATAVNIEEHRMNEMERARRAAATIHRGLEARATVGEPLTPYQLQELNDRLRKCAEILRR